MDLGYVLESRIKGLEICEITSEKENLVENNLLREQEMRQ